MNTFLHRPSHLILIRIIPLFSLLVLTLAACSPTSSTASTPAKSNSHSMPVAAATLPLGVQPCPSAVKDPAHWDPIIPTQSGTTQVGKVSCGNLLGDSSLQALVNVYHQGTGQILDTYVYTNIASPHPSRIFKLENLEKGDARISADNTIITNEVDENSSVNKGQGNAVLRRDLAREFRWSASARTFVQVAFPGIFPDLTRYQAEIDQAQVNQGSQPWKRDAAMTAQACAENFLKWFPNPAATVQSGGGPQDPNAVVLVKNADPGSDTITVTLSRLAGNTNGGIWEVTDVGTNAVSITSLHDGDRLISPTTVTGTGTASDGFIGTMTVFDHLYDQIGLTTIAGDNPSGTTTFSAYTTYTSSFQSGVQEGIVAIYVDNNTDGSIAAAIIKKVLLSPTP